MYYYKLLIAYDRYDYHGWRNKNNYFILFVLLFCANIFCAESNKIKNILHGLRMRETTGAPLKLRSRTLPFSERIKTREGQDIIKRAFIEPEKYYRCDSNALIEYCMKNGCGDVDFLLDCLSYEHKDQELILKRTVAETMQHIQGSKLNFYSGRLFPQEDVYRLYRLLEYLIIDRGLNLNFIADFPLGGRQVSPLHYAIYLKDHDMIKFLLQHGACKTIKDGRGDSPADFCHHYIAFDTRKDCYTYTPQEVLKIQDEYKVILKLVDDTMQEDVNASWGDWFCVLL